MLQLTKGRDSCLPSFPMAIGAAHPCLEAWLMSDGVALAKAMGRKKPPKLPKEPEKQSGPGHKVKKALAKSVNVSRSDLSAQDKTRIAAAMKDLVNLCRNCPSSFA